MVLSLLCETESLFLALKKE